MSLAPHPDLHLSPLARSGIATHYSNTFLPLPCTPGPNDTYWASRARVFDAYWEPRLETRILYTQTAFQPRGMLHKNVAGILLCLPGAGCLHSTATAMIHTMDTLRHLPPPHPGQPHQQLLCLAVDHPGHGEGPSTEHFLTLEAYHHWLTTIIAGLRAYNIPIWILGRSAGATLALDYATRPEAHHLAGVIAMSGYHASWFAYEMNHILEQRMAINWIGLRWIARFDGYDLPLCQDPKQLRWVATLPARAPEWRWVTGSATFAQPHCPVLVLYGRCDGEYPQPDAEELWTAYAHDTGTSLLVNPSAGHDHFHPERTPRPAMRLSRHTVQAWIGDHLRQHHETESLP